MKMLACFSTALALAAVVPDRAIASTTVVPIDPSTPFHATVESSASPWSSGPFVDRYTFDLATASTLTASVDVDRLMLTSMGVPFMSLDVDNAQVGIYRSTDATLGDGNDVLLASFALTRWDQPTPPIGDFWEGHGIFWQAPLQFDAGANYYVQVSGMPAGQDGYRYDIGVADASVPEPAAAASMAAGLGLLGGLAQRRRRSALPTPRARATA